MKDFMLEVATAVHVGVVVILEVRKSSGNLATL